MGGADPVDLALADDVDRHAAYPAVVGLEEVDDERVLDHLDARVGLDAVQRLDEGPADLAAGRVAAGVGDPVAVVAALAGQQDLAGRVAVELRTERDELADPLRSLGDEGGHGLDVAEADAGDEGVAQVLLRRVRRVHRRGDAALGPGGRALVEDRLGDEQDGVDLLPEPQGRGQPGDAGPDDDDVDVGGPARRWGVEPAREAHGVGHAVSSPGRLGGSRPSASSVSCRTARTDSASAARRRPRCRARSTVARASAR